MSTITLSGVKGILNLLNNYFRGHILIVQSEGFHFDTST
jgi:hypothetical protein